MKKKKKKLNQRKVKIYRQFFFTILFTVNELPLKQNDMITIENVLILMVYIYIQIQYV